MATGTAMSEKMEQDILMRWLKNTTTILGSAPTNWYVGVGTAGANTGVAEPASTRGYTRQALTFGATGGTGPCTISGPAATTTFPICTSSDWGNITHFGIYDAATSDNLLFWGSLTAGVSIAVNDRFEFAASAITIQAD